jgi:hypothetical protein
MIGRDKKRGRDLNDRSISSYSFGIIAINRHIMKRLIPSLFAGIIAVCSLFVSASFAQLLNNPESVAFDTLRNCYYVSNWGNGTIVRVDSLGQQSVFSDTLTRVAGLYLLNDVLYAASNQEPFVSLVGFDIVSGEMVLNIPVPGSGLLNDPVVDSQGYMYVSDFYNSKIYKFDLEARTVWEYANGDLGNPNGLEYDALHNRLLMGCQGSAGFPIRAVQLEDSSVTVVVNTGLGAIDGLALDHEGRLYFSSWETNSIHRYDSTFTNPPELYSEGHDAPADITINFHNGLLAVPNFYWNFIDFIPIESAGNTTEVRPLDFSFVKCYPNPFNSATNIEYQVLITSNISLDIFDSLGRSVKHVFSGLRAPGIYTTTWEADSQASGTFFARLRNGDAASVRTLRLVR